MGIYLERKPTLLPVGGHIQTWEGPDDYKIQPKRITSIGDYSAGSEAPSNQLHIARKTDLRFYVAENACQCTATGQRQRVDEQDEVTVTPNHG